MVFAVSTIYALLKFQRPKCAQTPALPIMSWLVMR
jgi:hypothetical protein